MPVDTQIRNSSTRNAPLKTCRQQTLDNEGVLDCDGALDGDDSNELCWTYNESSSTTNLHATGCTICVDWKAHYEDDWLDEEPSLMHHCLTHMRPVITTSVTLLYSGPGWMPSAGSGMDDAERSPYFVWSWT